MSSRLSWYLVLFFQISVFLVNQQSASICKSNRIECLLDISDVDILGINCWKINTKTLNRVKPLHMFFVNMCILFQCLVLKRKLVVAIICFVKEERFYMRIIIWKLNKAFQGGDLCCVATGSAQRALWRPGLWRLASVTDVQVTTSNEKYMETGFYVQNSCDHVLLRTFLRTFLGYM